MKTRKIGLTNYLAYGSGDFLGAGTTALTAAWLLYFYTTFCGLTPIEATFIFAAARVLDAVVSPLMGFLTDNFGTTWLGKRFGRRKFFILLGIPCVFSYSLMWVGVRALENVQLELWPGKVTALIGENGAGKSTVH
jgi:oligogalacturonide transporter